MALPPLPKKPKDPFSDKLGRVGDSALTSQKKIKEAKDIKIAELKAAGRLQELNDFIFGISKINPLD